MNYLMAEGELAGLLVRAADPLHGNSRQPLIPAALNAEHY